MVTLYVMCPMNFVFLAVSTFTKGEQMVPVLNKLGTHCACYGNHDFGERHIANADYVSEEPAIQYKLLIRQLSKRKFNF